MPISFYEVSVGSYRRTLDSLVKVLEKGLVHCHEKGIDPGELVEARLIGDMASLRFQIVSVAHHSLGALEGMRSGEFQPPSKPPALDYSGLQTLVSDTQSKLAALQPAEVDGLTGRDMIFKVGDQTLPFTTDGFLLSFSLPNFYFHATTAYDILRSKGVAIGKRDFLGRMAMKQ